MLLLIIIDEGPKGLKLNQSEKNNCNNRDTFLSDTQLASSSESKYHCGDCLIRVFH